MQPLYLSVTLSFHSHNLPALYLSVIFSCHRHTIPQLYLSLTFSCHSHILQLSYVSNSYNYRLKSHSTTNISICLLHLAVTVTL